MKSNKKRPIYYIDDVDKLYVTNAPHIEHYYLIQIASIHPPYQANKCIYSHSSPSECAMDVWMTCHPLQTT
jgi:hypothetical protein